jgi:hypothetical protein
MVLESNGDDVVTDQSCTDLPLGDVHHPTKSVTIVLHQCYNSVVEVLQ